MTAAHTVRRAATALACACVLAAVAGIARAGESAPDVSLRAAPATVVPTVEGSWPVRLTIVNRSAYGCYIDSLLVDVDQATPPAGAGPRHMSMRVSEVGSVSTADSANFEISLRAERVDSRVRLSLCAHSMRTPSFVVSADVQAQGYDPSRIFPATRIRVAQRDARLTRVPAGDLANGAGILMIRDPDAAGEADLLTAIQYRRSGYSFVLLDPPGSGPSGGGGDDCGPASLAAAQAALDTLARLPGVSPSRLGVWGRRSGGTLALLLAEQRPGLRAVVAEAAFVDPWATYRALPAAGRATFVTAAGRDSAGWRARSPLAGLDSLRVPALILHGELDARSPATAVHGLVARLESRHAPVEAHFFAGAGDSLPVPETLRLVRRFLVTHTREP
jgi:pimeloyl-ACP methyl ester carboxylesterase